MKLVADESVDFGIIRELRRNNVEVYSISEEIASIKDKSVLEIANEKKRLLITEDKDFGELVFRLKLPHHGVILIRVLGLDRQIKIQRVVTLLLEHFNHLYNNFTVITNEKMKIRKSNTPSV
jgi:predicted nuclease of predicted toxin-antitoxin system